VLTPLVFILRNKPSAIVLEQVGPVLPIWEAYAEVLRSRGYSVRTGIVNAEQYGVPQTRKRAVLIANADYDVRLPEPTHSRYHVRSPQRLDPGVKPWVSMAAALGWDEDMLVGFPRRADGRDDGVTIGETEYRARDFRSADRPAWAVTGKSRSWTRWAFERPATTVMGKPYIWPPGHKINADDIRRLGEDEAKARYGDRAGTQAYAPTLSEGLKLQTFAPDFPMYGAWRSKWQQLGNAVPPLLAERLILAALGEDEKGYARYASHEPQTVGGL
jgi:DNA (cytosine-5)-methyltransferase 1